MVGRQQHRTQTIHLIMRLSPFKRKNKVNSINNIIIKNAIGFRFQHLLVCTAHSCTVVVFPHQLDFSKILRPTHHMTIETMISHIPKSTAIGAQSLYSWEERKKQSESVIWRTVPGHFVFSVKALRYALPSFPQPTLANSFSSFGSSGATLPLFPPFGPC